jgi:hypothetical protein
VHSSYELRQGSRNLLSCVGCRSWMQAYRILSRSGELHSILLVFPHLCFSRIDVAWKCLFYKQQLYEGLSIAENVLKSAETLDATSLMDMTQQVWS